MKYSRLCFFIFFAALFVLSPTVGRADSKEERNKKVVVRWLKEVIRDENHKHIDEMLDEDFVLILSPAMKSRVTNSNKVKGVENMKKHREFAAKAFDIDFDLKDIIAEDDTVVVYAILTEDNGTEKISFPSVVIYKLDDGKIEEVRMISDTRKTLQK